MSHTDEHIAYREFRSKMLAMQERGDKSTDRFLYSDEPVLPFTELRATIKIFRAYVGRHVKHFLVSSPESEHAVRRALGIPSSLALTVDKWNRAGQTVWLFLPEHLAIRRAKKLLGQIGTHEGRAYIFDLLIQRTLRGDWYFTSSLDFTFRCLETAHSVSELEALKHLDEDLIKALLLMGVRQPSEIVHAFADRYPRPSGPIVRMFVEEGVIRHPDELSWVQTHGFAHRSMDVLAQDEATEARGLTQLLMTHDVSRKQIAGIFRFVTHRFNSQRLKTTIDLLLGAGIDNLSQVFECVGESLWTTESTQWRFLLEAVGVQDSEEVGQFKPILECRYDLSRELVIGLRALGADLAGIAACQSLLIALARREVSPAPLAELTLLSSAPHCLTIEQLALCTPYLQNGRDLAAYLQVMTQRGHGSAEAVMAFMGSYERVAPQTLDRLLMIVEERKGNASLESVAAWVQQASAGGNLDALEYLVGAVEIRDLGSLGQALKLVRVGRELLHYVVSEKQLDTFKLIRVWYDENIRGIKEWRGWGGFDALDKVLLNDAYQRKTFDLFEANQQSINAAVTQRVQALLGPWPYNEEETVREAYRQTMEATRLEERQVLLPMLAPILARTKGVLLCSLLESAWETPDEIDLQIDRLMPLLDELMSGRGPTSDQLNTLQADAIALIYRTDPHTVRSQWGELIGHEQHVSHLTLRDSYSMTWRCAQWRLKAVLDRRGLQALVNASQFSQRFRPGDFKHIFDACKNLKARYLDEVSADIHMLVPHLGVLLAAGDADSTVAQWNRIGFEALTNIDEESPVAHQRIEALHTLLMVNLGDALDAHTDEFVQRFSDEDAAYLASRLLNDTAGAANDGRTRLSRALARTRKKVLSRYAAWVAKEQGKFTQKADEQQETQLSAVVSKHPAAFFAKEATKLCTRYNKQMWYEKRHSHLVVFDRGSRQVVGMAMIYIEVLPALDPTVPSLIIRAINPTEPAMSSYTSESIVSAFFDVAHRIALDNKLACVAFPENGGLHVLSNHDGIAKSISEHFVNHGYSAYSRRSSAGHQPQSWQGAGLKITASFDAYERGSGAVDTLFVMWQKPCPIQQSPASAMQVA